MDMYLWLISQTENGGYDTYDSAVVAAYSEAEARRVHPRGSNFDEDAKESWSAWDGHFADWAFHPSNVVAIRIGVASGKLKSGEVICSSYNAG